MGEAIAATTSSTPRPARAQEIVNQNDFEEMLRRAESDPKGAEARALVSEVIKFIVLGGNKVPWGQAERAHEITRFLALYRYAGASNFFNTANPDDVHSPYAAQLCYPARELQLRKDDLKLHEKISDDLKFKKKSLDERMRVEQKYQQLAANNPVASALNFDFVLRNYMENLLGLHLDAKGAARCRPDKSLRELPKGLCGRLHELWPTVRVQTRAAREGLHVVGRTDFAVARVVSGDRTCVASGRRGSAASRGEWWYDPGRARLPCGLRRCTVH